MYALEQFLKQSFHITENSFNRQQVEKSGLVEIHLE